MRLRTANHHAKRQERRAAKERAYAIWERCAKRFTNSGSPRGIVNSGFNRRAAQKHKAWK